MKQLWYTAHEKEGESFIVWHFYRDLADRFFKRMVKEGWKCELGKEGSKPFKTFNGG